MEVERTTEWSKAEVAELAHYIFPGGYSAHDTKGDCWFDVDAAWRAVNFGHRFFRHVKGAKGGEPLSLQRWQAAILACLFGWKRPDGTRRFRIAYLEIPRGNGKSTLCVVIVGILLYIDDEPGADIFSAAGTRDQAREVFGPFKTNVLGNPNLKAVSECYQNSVTRIDTETGVPVGVYKAIAADADFQHGGSPHGIIFDELHVQPNRDLWDVLQTGKIKRRQPLTVAITTAGFDKHSICYEQRTWAEKVRDGAVDDPEFLPVVYAAEPEDDWTAPETWRKANPNMGISIREEDIAKECAKAKEMPGYENTFKRLHLDIWTEQETRWLSTAKWKKGDDDIPDLSGEPCWCGLDLSTTTDITAFVMAFERAGGGRYLIPRFWIPSENARRRSHHDRVDYLKWEKQGFVTLTEGDVVDYDVVRRDINKLNEQYNIQEIAIDRWNAAQITTQLMGDGFTVFPFGQGYASMSPAAKEFEKLVFGEQIQHGGNPVLRWMAANVAIEQDAAGNIKPSKKKSTERIDGIVAAVMAVGRATANAGTFRGTYLITQD